MMSEVVRARLWSAEFNLKTNPSVAKEHLTQIFEEVSDDDKRAKGKALALIGELAHSRHELALAAAAICAVVARVSSTITFPGRPWAASASA